MNKERMNNISVRNRSPLTNYSPYHVTHNPRGDVKLSRDGSPVVVNPKTPLKSHSVAGEELYAPYEEVAPKRQPVVCYTNTNPQYQINGSSPYQKIHSNGKGGSASVISTPGTFLSDTTKVRTRRTINKGEGHSHSHHSNHHHQKPITSNANKRDTNGRTYENEQELMAPSGNVKYDGSVKYMQEFGYGGDIKEIRNVRNHAKNPKSLGLCDSVDNSHPNKLGNPYHAITKANNDRKHVAGAMWSAHRGDDNATFITVNTSDPGKGDLEDWWEGGDENCETKCRPDDKVYRHLRDDIAAKVSRGGEMGNFTEEERTQFNRLETISTAANFYERDHGLVKGKWEQSFKNFLKHFKRFCVKVLVLILILVVVSTPLSFAILPKIAHQILSSSAGMDAQKSVNGNSLTESMPPTFENEKIPKSENVINNVQNRMNKKYRARAYKKLYNRFNLRDNEDQTDPRFIPLGIPDPTNSILSDPGGQSSGSRIIDLWPKMDNIFRNNIGAPSYMESIVNLHCDRLCQDKLFWIFIKYFVLVMLVLAIYFKSDTNGNVDLDARKSRVDEDVNKCRRLLSCLFAPFKYIYDRLPPVPSLRFTYPRWSHLEYDRLCFTLLTVSLLSLTWLYYFLLIVPYYIHDLISPRYSYTHIVMFADSSLDSLIYLHIAGFIYFKSGLWTLRPWHRKNSMPNLMYSVRCIRSSDGTSHIYQLPAPCSLQAAALILLDYYHRDFGVHDPLKYRPACNKVTVRRQKITTNPDPNPSRNHISGGATVVGVKRDEELADQGKGKRRGSKSEVGINSPQQSVTDLRRHLKFYDLMGENETADVTKTSKTTTHGSRKVVEDFAKRNDPISVDTKDQHKNLQGQGSKWSINNATPNQQSNRGPQSSRYHNFLDTTNDAKNDSFNTSIIVTRLTNKDSQSMVGDDKREELVTQVGASHNERFYDEEEYETRVRRRRARLQTSTELAFKKISPQTSATTDTDDVAGNVYTEQPFEQGIYEKLLSKDNKKVMKPQEIAQELFPSLVRNMQKYLRLTKQQMYYSMNMILEHLSTCIKYEMGPDAFTEMYFNQVHPIHNGKIKENIQEWNLISDIPVSENLSDNLIFQLRHKDIKLLLEVKTLPKYVIHEHIISPLREKFMLQVEPGNIV